MSDAEDPTSQWEVQLAEDVDLPGWVWLPDELAPEERSAYVDEVVPALQDLIGTHQADGTPNTEVDIRAILEAGLDARAKSNSYAMYQVWPVRAPAAVMCHLNRAATEDLPEWDDIDGRRFAAKARYIGPGLQISSRFTADTDQGPAELATVYFVFADGHDSVVVHLEPSVPQLVAHTMMGMGLYLNALNVTKADGSTFTSVASDATVADDDWLSDADGVS